MLYEDLIIKEMKYGKPFVAYTYDKRNEMLEIKFDEDFTASMDALELSRSNERIISLKRELNGIVASF